MAYNNNPLTMIIGAIDPGAATSLSLDSAWIAGTSGDTVAVCHSIREAVSSGTIIAYIYVTAITGTPDAVTMYMYNSADATEDPDRPDIGEGAIFTSGVVDVSGGAGWYAFTFTSVTVAAGDNYWFIVANTHLTSPTTNYPDVQSRGALDCATQSTGGVSFYQHAGIDNTNGWSADGTIRSIAPIIIKYPGASYGNPYVVAGAAHATNTNYRGVRFTPTEDLAVAGFYGSPDSNFGSMHIAQGSSEVLAYTLTSDVQRLRNNGTAFAPVTLTGGLPYDILQKASSSDAFGTTFTMGVSPPANVQAAGSPFTYVEGATLGSLSEVTTTVYAMVVEISNNPAIAGGSGGGFFYS